MAVYIAHSINQVDKDGVNIGDCLTAVLANQADKAAILKAVRENLQAMNKMRDDRIDEVRTKLATVTAERDVLGTTEQAQKLAKKKRRQELRAAKEAAEKELAEMGEEDSIV